VIEARGLARTFGKRKQEVRAVVGVDLDVSAGEIVGFLGPNGAGKTTTLRMLTTLLEPTAGTATVAGCDLIADPVGVRRRIGYVSQSGSNAPGVRAGEEVVDHARLYGMSTAEATERGRQLFRELDLEGLWERQPKSMSGGQRRRLDIDLGSSTSPSWSSSTSRRRVSTRRRGRTCGTTSRACARSAARRSS
jgi:ABC-2 type transport system ATP-binding protein